MLRLTFQEESDADAGKLDHVFVKRLAFDVSGSGPYESASVQEASMARPRKGEEKRASKTLGVRMPEELREDLEAAARASGRTLTDEVLRALEGYVKRQKRSRAAG